jgi:hypothetical protein
MESSRSRRRTAVNAAGLAVLLAVVVVVRLIASRGGARGDPMSFAYGFVAPAAYLVPGVVLLLRRRWHPVGWLLCLFAVSVASSFASDWGRVQFGGPWMLWYLDVFQGSPAWLPLVALLVVFPDGLAAQTPRQRRIGRAVLAVAVAAAVVDVFVTEVGADGGTLVPSPIGIAFVPRVVTDNITISVEFVALLVAFVGMLLRYRSSHDVARRQYRWVLSAIVFLIISLLIGLVGSTFAGDDNGPWWVPILFAYLAVPVSFMVAIMRYRLYEIDRLVSRTVIYSVVVIVLVAVYVVAVGVMTQVLPLSSDVAVAAATLAAAAVFSPLRRRVRREVDRRFNRTRFDAEREVEAFVRRLRDRTELLEVESDLSAVVNRTLQPAAMTLWFR